MLAPAGATIDEATALALDAAGVAEVLVRTPVMCLTRGGVCRRCMGSAGESDAHAGLAAALGLGHEAAAVFGLRTFHIGC